MKTVLGSFKNNPTITLDPGSKYPFSFGVEKAHMIVECFAEIKAFAEANPRKPKPGASKLVISRGATGYNVEAINNPERAHWIDLFGSAVLPTAYTLGATPAEVVAGIKSKNPKSEVTYQGEQSAAELQFQGARGRVL